MEFPGRDHLFAFATPAEFASFFPEYADTADEITSDKLTKLSDGRGYACILGIGILNFATNLTFLLGDAKRHGISISAVFILGAVTPIEGDGSFYPFPSSVRATASEHAPAHLQKLKSVVGLTVNRCTGTEELGLSRSRMFDADIENMEGAAGISACMAYRVPVFEIRAVSNMATTRDRESWKFNEALSALRQAVFGIDP